MDGFLVVDKPAGITSFDVVRTVRRLLKVRRVGHCGTLDPMATGVLPVAVGEATRLVEFVMEGEKLYRATLKLGEASDTQDAEGTILETRPIAGIDVERIATAAASLVGRIEQVPPMYSALKRNGVPLYELARKGVEVERLPRSVEIFRLDLLAVALPYVTFEVTCSKGTYVRTLAHDLGGLLGCGAHLTMLRRIATGAFREDTATPLADLTAAPEAVVSRLLPMATALARLRGFDLNEDALARLKNGVPPQIAGIRAPQELPSSGEIVTLLNSGQLVAVARFDPERQVDERGDFVLLRVFPANA